MAVSGWSGPGDASKSVSAQAEQQLGLGISGTKAEVISGLIQQPDAPPGAHVLALDPTPGGLGVGHETFALGPSPRSPRKEMPGSGP